MANAPPSFADQDDVDNVTGTGQDAIVTLGIQVNRSMWTRTRLLA